MILLMDTAAAMKSHDTADTQHDMGAAAARWRVDADDTTR